MTTNAVLWRSRQHDRDDYFGRAVSRRELTLKDSLLFRNYRFSELPPWVGSRDNQLKQVSSAPGRVLL